MIKDNKILAINNYISKTHICCMCLKNDCEYCQTHHHDYCLKIISRNLKNIDFNDNVIKLTTKENNYMIKIDDLGHDFDRFVQYLGHPSD